MKLIEIIITVGILVSLIAAAAFILAGGVETMVGDIVDIILGAVGRIGRAWRGN